MVWEDNFYPQGLKFEENLTIDIIIQEIFKKTNCKVTKLRLDYSNFLLFYEIQI